MTESLPAELVECDKLDFISILDTEISNNVIFCDSYEDCLFYVWIYGKEYELCCVT